MKKPNKRNSPEWWLKPFSLGWYPLATISADWEKRTRAEVKGMLLLTGLKKGRVLDLPCGVGRHSIALGKKGSKSTRLVVVAQKPNG